MTNYREILRLDSLGLNKTQIAESLGCSRTTVIHVLRQAEASCISYPLPEGMSDKELSEKLYPPSEAKHVFRMPDYEQIHKIIFIICFKTIAFFAIIGYTITVIVI